MLRELYKEYLLKHRSLIIIIACVVLISTISFFIVYVSFFGKTVTNEPKKDNSSVKELEIDNPKEEEVIVEEEYYYVDIKGAVANPNVYKIKSDARIIDVISLAGGLTSEADTSTLNLSRKVMDEMFIIIYTKSEIDNFKNKGVTTTEVIKYIESTCDCPDPSINDSCINDEVEDTNNSTLVSLNTATKEDLMTLPGIGEAKATAIIEYRDNNGLFKNVEDIKNVTGIGDSSFDKIKDFITL